LFKSWKREQGGLQARRDRAEGDANHHDDKYRHD
jgi:hypothetical protein